MNDFGSAFDEFLAQRRDEMKAKYNRVLPSGELLFNRFDKARYLNMGEGSSVYDTSIIMGEVEVGDNVWIGPYTLIEGTNAKVTIGSFVSINTGVLIFTHDSTKYYLSGGVSPYAKGAVSIGSNTVIGSMSMVGCGVAIGNHCVIGANSFVSRDVEDYTIAAGTPARPIGRVDIKPDGTVDFVYYTNREGEQE